MNAFRPLSQEEVGQVLDDLDKAVQRKPSLATHPTFVGSVRLALTAVHARQRFVAIEPLSTNTAPPPAPPTLEELLQKTTEAVKLMRKQGMTVDQARLRECRAVFDIESPRGKDPAHEAAEAEVGRLQGLLAGASARVSELEGLRTEYKEEQGRLALEIKNLRAQLVEVASLRESISKMREDAAQAAKRLEDTEAGHAVTKKSLREQAQLAQEKLNRARDVVAKVEFGVASRYTYKTTRKPIGSCPVCQGLNPEGLNSQDKEVGHRKACWLNGVVTALNA